MRFLSKSIQFWKSPIRIGDLPFRLVTCPLGRREPQHWAFFFGFTGSPRTSLFKFNVSLVFCAGFTTLSRLICCFHVCCIWHVPFSLVAFHRPILSTYDVASFQLALVPSCILHLSNVPPSKLHLLFLFFLHLQFLPLFNWHFAFPVFLPIVMCASFRFAFSNCFSMFSRCKHPRTSAIRRHKVSQPSAVSATPATQSEHQCHKAPRLPRKMSADVTKRHACHAKCRGAPGN